VGSSLDKVKFEGFFDGPGFKPSKFFVVFDFFFGCFSEEDGID